jgi:hypothetical protein
LPDCREQLTGTGFRRLFSVSDSRHQLGIAGQVVFENRNSGIQHFRSRQLDGVFTNVPRSLEVPAMIFNRLDQGIEALTCFTGTENDWRLPRAGGIFTE